MLLKNRFFILMTVLLLIQQGVSAFSNFWLARIGHSVAAAQIGLKEILFLFFCLLFPYLPGGLSLVVQNLWLKDSFEQFLKKLSLKTRKNLSLWGNRAERDSVRAVLGGEAWSAFESWTFYLWRLLMRLMNVVFNVAAFSFILDPKLFLIYGVTFFLCFLFLKIQAKIIDRAQNALQSARIDLHAVTPGLWDQGLIGNEFTQSLWTRNLKNVIEAWGKVFIRFHWISEGSSIGMALVAFLPTLIFLLVLFQKAQGNAEQLTALLVLIPRFWVVLGATEESLSLLMQGPSQYGRLLSVFKKLEPIQQEADALLTLSRRIHWDQIQGVTQAQLAEILTRAGRTCIRGPNGSGKSSLLQWIHQREAAGQSFYFHVGTPLFGQAELSSGQQTKQDLLRVLREEMSPILLLDEWDAYLDLGSIEQFSREIDRVAQTRCVIEVRHRG